MVEQAGSVAGFAAVIGLAVLSALYFSQARDLKRLREWAGRAPERAAEMAAVGQVPGAPTATPVPGRVVAVPQRTPKPTPPAAAPAGSNGDAAPTAAEAAAGAEKQAGDAAKPAADSDAAKAADTAQEDGAEQAGGEKKDGPGPLRPPGMPAPASAAAAAAGAGAASISKPAPGAPAPGVAGTPAPGSPGPAPAGKPGPVAQPQRPPGSVLPPRTGTIQPVRRLPASGVGGPPPQAEKRKRNPIYVALAVIGVLVLGAAAAVGVPTLVNGSKDDDKPAASTTTAAKKKKATPVNPDAITVAVLNGTTIPGLAAQIGDRVDADGFTLGTVSNASQTSGQRANSVAMYARGHERDARTVARRLRISNIQPVDAESQEIAGDASVVVIVGSDKTQ